MQIVNVDGMHWVCTSNFFSPPGVVDVYDGMPAISVGSHRLYKQLAVILKCSASDMVIRFVDVQRQAGKSDFCYCICIWIM